MVVARVVVAVPCSEELLGKLEDEGEELEDLLGYALGFLYDKISKYEVVMQVEMFVSTREKASISGL